VPIVLKSGSLNLLEPLGPVQACNGIALPLTFNVPVYNNYICTVFIFVSLGGRKVPVVQIGYIRLTATSLRVLIFYRGVVENFALLGCDIVWLGKWLPTFRRNIDKTYPATKRHAHKVGILDLQADVEK
jgi:hypothetical protein